MSHTVEKSSYRAERVGSAVARYRAIEVKYGPQQEIVSTMDELRHVGLGTKGELQEVLVVMEETFGGKSTAARIFKRHIEKQLPVGSDDMPVIVATATASCTSRGLVVALLRGLNVRFASGMTEDAMWALWPKAAARRGVQMTIIDEIQHAENGRFSQSVTNTLKNQLSVAGPIVVMGTTKASALFTANDAFESRIYDSVALRPMRFGEPVDAAIWTKLCTSLDTEMRKAILVAATPGLGEDDLPEKLCLAARGRIGLLKKLVQTALRLAMRRGADVIERADLEKAIDVWSVPLGHAAKNPFRQTQG